MIPAHYQLPRGLYFDPKFISLESEKEIHQWLNTLYPIWEERYAKNHPPPPGKEQRWLLRPIYWLGNWQFACLNYFHPPKNIKNCCVKAEDFPAVLKKQVLKIETIIRRNFHPNDIPKGWKLNTCLINYYGSSFKDGKWTDTARVGEHKDFEPGPVASLSLGERAMFQFVDGRRGVRVRPAFQMWLTHGSLQVFGGNRFKDKLFHRVQRVDKKQGYQFPIHVENFKVRRINFTFRYVPEQYVIPYHQLPKEVQEDVLPYMKQLSEHSDFFRCALTTPK